MFSRVGVGLYGEFIYFCFGIANRNSDSFMHKAGL